MEHAIGEVVTLPDGRKAEVVETKRMLVCIDCVFIDELYCRIRRCTPSERTDHKSIIYKEVKE